MSRNTVAWSAKHRYPYIMLATELEPTRQSFLYYDQCAKEQGYEAGPQHHGYLFKVHVDETEELAEQAGRRYVEGPSNPFLEGNQGNVKNFIQNLPGLTSRTQLLPTVSTFAAAARGRDRINADGTVKPADVNGSYEQQIEKMSIISGTPKTVIPKIRTVLETLRPGSIFFWDGDGAMDHNDAMRSLRLMGEEVIPACREMARELDLPGPFDIDPATNTKLDPKPAEPSVQDPEGERARRRRRRRRTGRLDGGHPPGPTGPGRDAARAGAVSPRPHRRVAPARVDAHPGRAGRAAPRSRPRAT